MNIKLIVLGILSLLGILGVIAIAFMLVPESTVQEFAATQQLVQATTIPTVDCGNDCPPPTATLTPSPTVTPTPSPTITPMPTLPPTATPCPGNPWHIAGQDEQGRDIIDSVWMGANMFPGEPCKRVDIHEMLLIDYQAWVSSNGMEGHPAEPWYLGTDRRTIPRGATPTPTP